MVGKPGIESRPMSSVSAPFVGRDSELVELNAYGRAAFEANKGKVIFLTGEAGIGKTALCERFSKIMRDRYSNLRYGYAYCS